MDQDEEDVAIETRDATTDDGSKPQNNDSNIISDINSNTRTTGDMTVAVIAEQQDTTVAINSNECDGESNDMQPEDSQSNNMDVKSGESC